MTLRSPESMTSVSFDYADPRGKRSAKHYNRGCSSLTAIGDH